ncbi:MAG: hypothetical protein ACI8PZ_003149 [Myxococcota bacterium]
MLPSSMRVALLALALGCSTPNGARKSADPPVDEPSTTSTTPTGSTSSSAETLAVEVCNGVDDDGDGLVDEADPDVVDLVPFFADTDADGFGDPTAQELACAAPPATVADNTDCDDTRADVHPGAPRACDDHPDTDCDGTPDAQELDGDGDGWTPCDGDCDDTDPAAAPGLQEVCDGRDTDCDGRVDADPEPSSCGWCPGPGGFATTPVHLETWNPCLLDDDVVGLCYLDPEVEPDSHVYGRRLHRVAWRDDIRLRRQLFIYLPPGDGWETVTIPRMAAYAGFRTISLGYVNHLSLKTECGYEHPSPRTCYGDARHEQMFGDDTSDVYNLAPADGAVERLRVLLLHLEAEHPGQGWGDYVAADGSLRWDNIVVGGWSAGSGNGAYLAHQVPLDGTLVFAGPQDLWEGPDAEPRLADWILEPRATPGCVHWGAYHTLDSITLLTDSWDAIGIPAGESDIDEVAPPYDGRQRLASTAQLDGCDPHQSMGRDGCIRDETLTAYLYMMCEVAATEPESCP